MTQHLRSVPFSRLASDEERACTQSAPPGGESLRAEVRRAIETGRIPARAPARIWGGDASGAQCTVCAMPVAKGELEFEVEFDGLTGPWQLHSHCLDAWESERRAYLGGNGLNGKEIHPAAKAGAPDLSSQKGNGSIAAGERDPDDQQGSSG